MKEYMIITPQEEIICADSCGEHSNIRGTYVFSPTYDNWFISTGLTWGEIKEHEVPKHIRTIALLHGGE